MDVSHALRMIDILEKVDETVPSTRAVWLASNQTTAVADQETSLL